MTGPQASRLAHLLAQKEQRVFCVILRGVDHWGEVYGVSPAEETAGFLEIGRCEPFANDEVIY